MSLSEQAGDDACPEPASASEMFRVPRFERAAIAYRHPSRPTRQAMCTRAGCGLTAPTGPGPAGRPRIGSHRLLGGGHRAAGRKPGLEGDPGFLALWALLSVVG